MTSQRVERNWIRTGGYGQFRGKWVNKVNSFFLSITFKIPQGREFEEQPAVPQPAYVFTEYPFGLDDAPATFQVPPVYSEEDPVKRDEPPPPYINDNDTEVLIENQEN